MAVLVQEKLPRRRRCFEAIYRAGFFQINIKTLR